MNITKPTFIVNKQKCLQNIEKIHVKTSNSAIDFRPHFKTHQSHEIGEWFKNFSVNKITVSSVDMAFYFIEKQWNDITIAFPFNILELERTNTIDEAIEINLLVESLETIKFIAKNATRKYGIFIELEINYARSGVEVENTKSIYRHIRIIEDSEKLFFKGFLIHAGNTYLAQSAQEVLDIHTYNLSKIKQLRSIFLPKFPQLLVSYGDTPTASLANEFEGINELRPGNFIFYDLMQRQIGSCQNTEIAGYLAAPVVRIKPEKNEFVMHAGAVHLSKEFLFDPNGQKNYGEVFFFHQNYTEIDYSHSAEIYSLSQEHALAKAPKAFIEKIKIGDVLAILPIHSCLTANLMKNNTLIV
jgi:D-serine deaminase-like pyridoxal phosphate-dependent protein